VFEVRPDIKYDIYYLYCFDNTNTELINYNIALIPDFKTSVMMNYLFRNIKENSNIDLIEESDTEEEFENIDVNKFVNLYKKITMKCSYSYKFKKWFPVSVANNADEIVSLQQLSNYKIFV
jgi:hypothetical protein